MTDPIADMLTRIRNAVQAKHAKVDMPASRLKVEIARILKEEGYIAHYKTAEEGSRSYLTVFLKYGPKGEQVITNIERVSRPGCRVYVSKSEDPESARWTWHQHRHDFSWSHDRQGSSQAGIWRRASLQYLLRTKAKCRESEKNQYLFRTK